MLLKVFLPALLLPFALAMPKEHDVTITKTTCTGTTTSYIATVTVTGKPPASTLKTSHTKAPAVKSSSSCSSSTSKATPTSTSKAAPAYTSSTSTVTPAAQSSTTSSTPVATGAANGLSVSGNVGIAAVFVAGLVAVM